MPQQRDSHSCSLLANTAVILTRRCIGHVRNCVTHAAEPVTEFTWTNRNRMTASVMTYGATVTRVSVPNRWAISEDVVLGFDTLDEYVAHSNDPAGGAGYHFGSVIGRCANVIAGAEYELRRCDVVELTANVGDATDQHHLDGGLFGLGRVNWLAHIDGTEVVMSHVSPDGDEGYPGTLMVHVRFAVTVDNRLLISYTAQTDRRTPVNLSHRLYMNLGGHAAGASALRQHMVSVNASQQVEYDKYDSQPLVPTGRLTKIGDSAFDFRTSARLEQRLRKAPLGCLHETFVVNGNRRTKLNKMARKRAKPEKCVIKASAPIEPKIQFVGRMIHPKSGRVLEIYSSQRCVEFSTGHQLPYVEALSSQPATPKTPSAMSVVSANPTELCTNIIEDIVDDFADTERFVVEDILNNAFNKMIDAQMEKDGTVSNEVARQIVEQLCREMHQIDEQEALRNAEASIVEEEEAEQLPRPIAGKDSAQYVQNGSFYAQTQNFPDAVHHRGRFSDVLLTPDRIYRHELVYKFGLHMGNVPPMRVFEGEPDSSSDGVTLTSSSSAVTRSSSSLELSTSNS